MKTILFVLAVITLFLSSAFADMNGGQDKFVGTWELIDITSVNVADSSPRGQPAIKHYYSVDGKMYGLAANEKLNQKTDSAPYTFSNGVRTLTKPSGEILQTKIDFPATNTMRYFFDEGNEIWTFRKMLQDKAYNAEIEPRSVEVLRTIDKSKQLTCLDVKYDTNDYSKLTLKKRSIGVWEVIAYKNFPTSEMPPYGFPNEKYVFTENGKFFKIEAFETEIPTEQSPYEVKGNTIIVRLKNEKGEESKQIFEKVKFDQWGRMVLPYKDIEIVLKLLQRDTTKIPVLPGKICLLYSP